MTLHDKRQNNRSPYRVKCERTTLLRGNPLQQPTMISPNFQHVAYRVVRVGHTLEDLEALERGRTAGGLVRQHTTHNAPEDAAEEKK